MGNNFDKPIVFLTPGCPHAMRFNMFLTESRLLGKVQLIQDSKEAREYVSQMLELIFDNSIYLTIIIFLIIFRLLPRLDEQLLFQLSNYLIAS